jgi:hypothetical protein
MVDHLLADTGTARNVLDTGAVISPELKLFASRVQDPVGGGRRR